MAIAKKTTLLKLHGSYGLERAEELSLQLKAAIIERVQATKPLIEIDLSGVTDLDLSAIQLFYAAKKSAMTAGGDLLFIGALKPALSARLRSSTLISALVADGPALAEALPSFMTIEVSR